MAREAWGMSARLAWQRPWFRLLSLLLLVFTLLTSWLFLSRTLPEIQEGTMVFHTNVYNGIDDIREWGWVFVWPIVWCVSVLGGIIASYGVFQRDRLLAQGIIAWLYAWSLPWALGLMYLMSVNTHL